MQLVDKCSSWTKVEYTEVVGGLASRPVMEQLFARARGRLGVGLTHRRALVPLVAGSLVLAGAIAGFVFLLASVEAWEEQELDDRADVLTAMFEPFAEQIETIVVAAGAVGEATGGEMDALGKAMAGRVEASVLSSVGLLRFEGGSVSLLSSVGRREPLLPGRFDERDLERLAASRGVEEIRVVRLTTIEGQRLASFVAAPGPDSDYLVYGELLVPDVFALTRAGDIEEIEFALYIGPAESPDALLISNAQELPLAGRRRVAQVELGGQAATAVIAASGSLVGGWTRAAPWLVLGFGLAGCVAVAGAAHARQRHRAERERASRQLRESEERFRRAFDDGAIGMALLSSESVLVRVNGALADALGYGQEELLGKTINEITHPDDQAACKTTGRAHTLG